MALVEAFQSNAFQNDVFQVDAGLIDLARVTVTKSDNTQYIFTNDVDEVIVERKYGKVTEATVKIVNFDGENSGKIDEGDRILVELSSEHNAFVKIVEGVVVEPVTDSEVLTVKMWHYDHLLVGSKISKTWLVNTKLGDIFNEAIDIAGLSVDRGYLLQTIERLPARYTVDYRDVLDVFSHITSFGQLLYKIDAGKRLLVFPKQYSIVFVDGFNNYPVASDDINWVESGDPTQGSIDIDTAVKFSFNNSLKLDKTGTGGELSVSHGLSQIKSDCIFIYSFRVVDNTKNAELIIQGDGGDAIRITMGNNGYLTYYDGFTRQSINSISNNTWYSVKIEVSWVSKLYNVILYDSGGIELARVSGRSILNSHTEFTTVKFTAGDSTAVNTLYISDLGVYHRGSFTLDYSRGDFTYKFGSGSRKDIVNSIVLVGGNETLEDDFTSTALEQWSQIGLGTAVVSNGELTLEHTGEFDLRSNVQFRNIDLKVDVKIDGLSTSKKAYIFFRSADSSNEYFLEIDATPTANALRLYKTVAGTDTLLASDISVSINTDTYYLFQVTTDTEEIKVYMDGDLILSATDNSHKNGYFGLRVNNSKAYFDNFKCISDRKVITSVEDTYLVKQSNFELKRILITRPEVKTKTEAIEIAELELQARKIRRTSIAVDLYEGTTVYSIGNVINLVIGEQSINAEYTVLEITQMFKENEWTTRLVLAETIPRLEEIIKRLNLIQTGLLVENIGEGFVAKVTVESMDILNESSSVNPLLLKVTDSMDILTEAVDNVTVSVKETSIWGSARWGLSDWSPNN